MNRGCVKKDFLTQSHEGAKNRVNSISEIIDTQINQNENFVNEKGFNL